MRYFKPKVVLFVLCVLFLNIRFVSATEDKLVAIVNDEIITEGDVRGFVNILNLQLSSQFEGELLKEKMRELEEGAVDNLIDDMLISQEAKRLGYEVEEEIIKTRIKEFEDRFISDEEFDLYLKMHKLTPADIEKKISDQILMREIIEREVRSRVFVHPKEVTDYFEQNKEQFQDVERIDLDSMFIRIEDTAQEASGKASEVMKLLAEGEDFASLRDEFSDSSPIGIVEKGQLNPEIEEVVFKLKVGEVTVPIQTNNGIYIFKVNEKISAGDMKLEEVRDKIYQFLFERKFGERFVEWIDGIKEKAYILIK